MAETKEFLVELAPPRLTDESAEVIHASLKTALDQGIESFNEQAMELAEEITNWLPLDMSREAVSIAAEGIARQIGFLGTPLQLHFSTAYIKRHYSTGGM